MEGESLAACAVMGFHYEDESDLCTGSQAWNCLLLSEDLQVSYANMSGYFPCSLLGWELQLKWLSLGNSSLLQCLQKLKRGDYPKNKQNEQHYIVIFMQFQTH